MDQLNTFAVLPLSANAVSREGFDLIECTWKLSAKQKEQGITKEMRAPKMVYLPSLESQLIEYSDSCRSIELDLRAVLLNSIDAQRTAIVKALIENGSNVIPEDSVSLAVCVASMLAEKETERLNGDRIEAWFTNSEKMQAYLQSLAETRSKETGKAIALILAALKNTYLATVKKLAAPNPGITETDRDKLLNVLGNLCDESAVCGALIKRLSNIEYVSAL